MNTVLIIDDEDKLRALLARIIRLENYEVVEAESAQTALKKLEQYPVEVILCDVKLPDAYGVDFVKNIKTKYPTVEIILLTAYGNIADGVQAIKNGAFDYITKGDDNSKILPLLARALEKVHLSNRVRQLEKLLDERRDFEKIIGTSQPILSAIDLAKKVAITDTTVLLTGETGTGKEVFAQAIHQASKRHTNSFVAINCAAFSKDLLESQMFGHIAGAFTGAVKDQKGIFEEANQGTIFLGEMALDLQAKLLRVLETGQFLRVGSTKALRADVRIIAATHRDLLQEVQKGSFREDLYYRISVFHITLPPLRERVSDVELLAHHFLHLFAAKINKKIARFAPEALDALRLHTWHGNIRELKNVIERAVILADTPYIAPEHLPTEIAQLAIAPTSTSPKQLSAFELASVEKLHMQKVMNYTKGNKTEAAELLGIALTTLYRKLEEYKIS